VATVQVLVVVVILYPDVEVELVVSAATIIKVETRVECQIVRVIHILITS